MPGIIGEGRERETEREEDSKKEAGRERNNFWSLGLWITIQGLLKTYFFFKEEITV